MEKKASPLSKCKSYMNSLVMFSLDRCYTCTWVLKIVKLGCDLVPCLLKGWVKMFLIIWDRNVCWKKDLEIGKIDFR